MDNPGGAVLHSDSMIASPKVRRVLALCALAWLNLLMQPCLAQPIPLPAPASHCGHNGDAPGAPCAEMTADGCVTNYDSGIVTTPVCAPARPSAQIALLPPLAAGGAPAIPGRRTSEPHGGPPLTIRYCTLRN